jgi:excisionase family DNA binding protein
VSIPQRNAAETARQPIPFSDHGSAESALEAKAAAPLPSPVNGVMVRPLLTADDVAAFMGVPPTLVYALARRGDLPAIRIGERYIRFRLEAIERWIVEQEDPA